MIAALEMPAGVLVMILEVAPAKVISLTPNATTVRHPPILWDRTAWVSLLSFFLDVSLFSFLIIYSVSVWLRCG